MKQNVEIVAHFFNKNTLSYKIDRAKSYSNNVHLKTLYKVKLFYILIQKNLAKTTFQCKTRKSGQLQDERGTENLVLVPPLIRYFE